MARIKILQNRREVANTIRFSNRKVNCFVISSSEKIEHQDRKFKVFQFLRNQNKDVYVEPILLSGLRPDLIDADEKVIFEIVNTEKEESLIKKKKDYPFEVRIIRCSDKWSEKICL